MRCWTTWPPSMNNVFTLQESTFFLCTFELQVHQLEQRSTNLLPSFVKQSRSSTLNPLSSTPLRSFPVVQTVKNLPTMQETLVWSLGQGDSLEKPTPVLLPGESHWQRSLVGYSPCGHKESDTTERLHSLMLSCYVGERGERFPHSLSFFKLKYSWFSTNFCCTAEWLSSTHKHFVLYSFPLCFNTGYGIYNSSLCYPAGLFVCLL